MLGTIIALTAIIVLLLRGCKENNSIAEGQHLIDSLSIVVKFKDSIYVRTLISKNDSIAAARFRSDSLQRLISKKDKALDVSKAEVAVLVAKSYLINKDSIQQRLDNCDSIKREAIYLAENVTDYQRAQETLMENNRQLLATMQRTGDIKDSAYKDLKNDFDFLTIKFSKLDYAYQKNNKKLFRGRTINYVLGGIAIVTTGILLKK